MIIIIQLKVISFMGLQYMDIESVSGFINPPRLEKYLFEIKLR